MAYNPIEIVKKTNEYSAMLNNGIDPVEDIKSLKEELARTKEELSKLKANESIDLEKKISELEDGKVLISARDKKLKELMIEFLSKEPSTSFRINTIMSNFKEEAQRILNDKG